MLGFLAAIITVLFAVINTRVFNKYKEKGFFDIFMAVYLFSIVNLIATFVLSIFSFSKNYCPTVFNITIMSATNNIVQLGLVSCIILSIFKKSIKNS